MNLHVKGYYGDLLILLILGVFFIIGLLTLYSAVNVGSESFSPWFIKQVGGLIIGIGIGTFITLFSYKTIIIWGALIHYAILGLLTGTLLLGSRAMGAQRWFSIGFIKFQPSELAKITLILWIVNYFFNHVEYKVNLKNWFTLLFMIGLSSLLITKQPDLGSGLIVAISGFLVLYIAGLPNKIIISLSLLFMITFPIIWNLLHDYQKKRVIVFLGGGQMHKERYQLEQSRVAVGSGGVLGKGYLQGTQKNLRFLPESRTDFIFSTFAEEWGLLGVLFIIILYIILLMRIFIQSYFIDDFYPYLLFLGLFFPLIVSAILNIGMVVGLFPIVGIPLPCMSYGITHTWGTCISLGIINSILRESGE